MEFNLLYLKYLLIIQCFCVSLEVNETAKFTRINQQVTFECPFEKHEIMYWLVDGDQISHPNWTALTNDVLKANVISDNVNILNITPFKLQEIDIGCKSTAEVKKFKLIIIYNDNGNLYPSSETPSAIKDKMFTLKCKTKTNSATWYTGNGTAIAKYIGGDNQNRTKYFGSRQETSCQNNICTLSITSVSLDEDNMSIICTTNIHASMFNITVFVLPKMVTIKATSDTVAVENQNKSYECLIKDTKPKFSVFWQLTLKNGSKKNITKNITNTSSPSGKLITSSSKLTLKLEKKFEKLHCVAYFPNIREFDSDSATLNMLIKYSPEKKMKLNILKDKVCVGTPIKFQCSWKGGNPSANITLIYKDKSNTSEDDVELVVTSSRSHPTVKCLGTHIAKNVSREKTVTIYYPPEGVEIKSDEPFFEGQKGNMQCKVINGYPQNYTYRWEPSNSNSENFTFSSLDKKQNNEVHTCFASNMCNKNATYKKHWIKVEYKPDITTIENVALLEYETTILKCSAKGNPDPEVRLECGNQSFPSNSTLTFSRRNSSDVSCVARANSSKYGILTSRKKIYIMLKYAPDIDIEISKEINNTIIKCTVLIDGNPTNYTYKLKQKWGTVTKNTYNKNVLSINSPSFNNTGTWECHVRNQYFHVVNSSNYKILMKPIFSSISKDNEIKNVSIGDSITLKQCFYSHPKSEVKWEKNGELIDSGKYSTIVFKSTEFPFKGNCTSLKIEDMNDNDFGTYTLILENTEGKVEKILILRFGESEATPWGIIIGCSVTLAVILIILGLLAYKCYKIRDRKVNNEYSSTKAINNIAGSNFEQHDVHEVPNVIYNSGGQLIELNAEDIYANVSQQPNNASNLHAKPNKAGNKPDDVSDLYAKPNKPGNKPDDTEENSPDDIYENSKQINKPESVQECHYADLEFKNKAGKRRQVPKPKEEETIYADIVLDC